MQAEVIPHAGQTDKLTACYWWYPKLGCLWW